MCKTEIQCRDIDIDRDRQRELHVVRQSESRTAKLVFRAEAAMEWGKGMNEDIGLVSYVKMPLFKFSVPVN